MKRLVIFVNFFCWIFFDAPGDANREQALVRRSGGPLKTISPAADFPFTLLSRL